MIPRRFLRELIALACGDGNVARRGRTAGRDPRRVVQGSRQIQIIIERAWAHLRSRHHPGDTGERIGVIIGGAGIAAQPAPVGDDDDLRAAGCDLAE